MIYQQEEPISKYDTAGDLHARLAQIGAGLLVKTLKDLERGDAPRVAQDDSAASYAPKLSKQDGRIDWTQDAVSIANKIRGFNPWPIAWCRSGSCVAKNQDCAIRIHRAEPSDREGKPGTVLSASNGEIEVAAGSGSVKVLELQLVRIAGLEQEPYPESRRRGSRVALGAGQERPGVGVVPAGVHRAGMNAREREAGLLRDR